MTETSEAKSQTKGSVIRSGFVIGISENRFLGRGWHEREVHGLGGIPFRATQERAEFRLEIPAGPSRLKLLVFAHVALLGGLYEGEVSLDGRTVGAISIETESWALRTFVLPPSPTERVGEFLLVNKRTLVPGRVIPDCRDYRVLGCGVGAAIIEGVA